MEMAHCRIFADARRHTECCIVMPPASRPKRVIKKLELNQGELVRLPNTSSRKTRAARKATVFLLAMMIALLPTTVSAFTTFPTTPPILTIGNVNRINAATAEINFGSTIVGTYYYQVDGITPASAATLVTISLINHENSEAVLSGNNILVLNNLTTETHTVYIAAITYSANTNYASNLLVITIPPVYTMHVVGGTAKGLSGTVQESGSSGVYHELAQIQITADQAPEGYVFDVWTSLNDGYFADSTSPTTTFFMPTMDTVIMANWKEMSTQPHTTSTVSTAASPSTPTCSSVSSVTVPGGDSGVGNNTLFWIAGAIAVSLAMFIICLAWMVRT